MGDVVELAQARERRADHLREMVEQSVMHPALRWMTSETPGLAHRRRREGDTACGLDGPLVLAELDTERCAVCYPRRGSVAL